MQGNEVVVVDTGVFGAVLGTDPHGLVGKYERHLLGGASSFRSKPWPNFVTAPWFEDGEDRESTCSRNESETPR